MVLSIRQDEDGITYLSIVSLYVHGNSKGLDGEQLSRYRSDWVNPKAK